MGEIIKGRQLKCSNIAYYCVIFISKEEFKQKRKTNKEMENSLNSGGHTGYWSERERDIFQLFSG